ncbi:hypothetical protein PAPHI01_2330 [Pancytospora philotis]|nr:hypothetical protein PAPHI01_2330 [Pancytospora philotis]
MGILLAACLFAQLTYCALIDTDEPTATTGSTFAPSMGLLEQAAADGSRGGDGNAAARTGWSHPFLGMLYSKLELTRQEVERIKYDSLNAAAIVPGVFFSSSEYAGPERDASEYAGPERDALADTNPLCRRCNICSINESNRAVFENLLRADLDDLCNGYTDLQRVAGTGQIDGMNVAARILTLLSAFASVSKASVVGGGANLDSLYCANYSGGVATSFFRVRLLRLLEQCMTLCDTACNYMRRSESVRGSAAGSSVGALVKESHIQAFKSTGDKKMALVDEFDRVLSRLEAEMAKLIDLNARICRPE